jgi:hypothetical protein
LEGSGSSLTVRQVLRLCLDVAAGLAFLHATPLTSQGAACAGMGAADVELEHTIVEVDNDGKGSDTLASPSKRTTSSSSFKQARIVHRGAWVQACNLATPIAIWLQITMVNDSQPQCQQTKSTAAVFDSFARAQLCIRQRHTTSTAVD